MGDRLHALQAAVKKSAEINSEKDALWKSGADGLLQLSENGYEQLKFRGILEERINAFRKIWADASVTPIFKAGTASMTFKFGCTDGGDPGWYDVSVEPMDEGGVQETAFWEDNHLNAEDEESVDAMDGVDSDPAMEFPPSDAPEEVRTAWCRTMADLDEKEQFMALYLFMAQSIIANLRVDADCEYKGLSYPGDPDYENIFSADLNDWEDLLENIDEYLNMEEEDFPGKKQQISEKRKIIDTFRTNIWAEIN